MLKGSQGWRSQRSEPLTTPMHPDAIPERGTVIHPPLPSGERQFGGAGGTLFPLLGYWGKAPRSYVFVTLALDCFVKASFKRRDSRLVKSSKCV